MTIIRHALVLALAGGLLAACASPAGTSETGVTVQVDGGSYTDISPAQLAKMLESEDFFFVNTHVPYEGEIEPTDAFIPYDETAQRLADFPADKAAKIVVYCRSDRMSGITAQELVRAGYTNVWNLDGGMVAWDRAGYPLIQE